ncbi:MAG: polynucleotide adenylyltransferase PcnB [Myxococcota bacterium]
MSWIIVALRAVRTAKDWRKGQKSEPKLVVPPRPAAPEITLKPIGPAVESRGPEPRPPRPEPRPPRRDNGQSRPPLDPNAAPTFTGRAPAALQEAREQRDPANGRDRERAPSAKSELPLHLIDHDALDVVRRLKRHGHTAYLVGGCVRDLSLGLVPKDFDVATSARPEQIRGIFRNCRIIGRRFRLAHVYFRGGKVIETATFRAMTAQAEPDEEGAENADLLIRQDNVFGTEEQDAQRRDFTINGLFFDPASGRIIDHVGGRADLAARTVRMIGDPDIRLREDPARILRAIRIAAKTELSIDPELLGAMKRHQTEIPRCSRPRLFEETMKLLRGGRAERGVAMLDEHGLLAPVIPALAAFFAKARASGRAERVTTTFRVLAALDEVSSRSNVSDTVIIATLFMAAVEAALEDGEPLAPRNDDFDAPEARGRPIDRSQTTLYAQRFLLDRAHEMGATRKMLERLRQVVLTQRHFERRDNKKGRRRVAPEVLVRRAHFPESLDLFEILAIATTSEPHLSEVAHWRAHAANPIEDGDQDEHQPAASATPTGGRRRRRRRGGRSDEASSPAD